jgi:DNA (cytosine-5)-methyltransferase 1
MPSAARAPRNVTSAREPSRGTARFTSEARADADVNALNRGTRFFIAPEPGTMVNQSTIKFRMPPCTSLSLFSGAGGLDLGLEAAGFAVAGCIEIDSDCRATLQRNRPGWALSEPGDIFRADARGFLMQFGLRPRELDLLSGGPPCQPFSKSAYWATGKTARLRDPRANSLEAYFDFVSAALPRVFLLENVKGLVHGCDVLHLFERKLRFLNQRCGTNYVLQVIHVNAAEYGVPQMRERVFLIADRDGREIVMPDPKCGVGASEPFRTAWDAIGHCDYDVWPNELLPSGKWAGLIPSIPEGKNYLWHSDRGGGKPLFGWRTKYWSFLLKLAKNRPSWTLQAAPGPATGPFHWRNRLLSTQELALLQTFPSTYEFCGNQRSQLRQVGNAVPSAIGEMLGLEILRQFFGQRPRHDLRLIPSRRYDCPEAETVRPVTRKYLFMVRAHNAHPGEGLGPRAQLRTQTLEALHS